MNCSRGPSSRTRTSCNNCRKRHQKCNGEQPCQRCWQHDAECIYGQILFSVKEWEPRGAGLPSALTTRCSTANSPCEILFVSENSYVESLYRVPQSEKSSSINEHAAAGTTISPVLQYDASVERCPEERTDVVPICPPIQDPTSAFFMERYCNIIGPWFDMFDTNKRWSRVVPHLSLSNKSLFQSIIASCAKQYSLVSSECTTFALNSYNHALKELTYALGDSALKGSAALFASCLLVGYCEMIDAKSLDWHTHLSGTFSLCSTQGWHGLCGGVAQSCFWVYCRMDLLASIARSERTLLDTSSWLPTAISLQSHHEALEWKPDSWCNQVVLLLAQTHNLLCDVGRSSYDPSKLAYLGARWDALSTAIGVHEACRPAVFHPVINLPPSGPAYPFERIVYTSSAAAAATQMLDLAKMFFILAHPDPTPEVKRARLTSWSISQQALNLSRKIVANSITNRQTIAWANAVQIISSSGQILVAEDERVALLQVLQDIKSESGWSTHRHIEALTNWWSTAAIRDDVALGSEARPGSNLMLRQVGEFLFRMSEIYFN